MFRHSMSIAFVALLSAGMNAAVAPQQAVLTPTQTAPSPPAQIHSGSAAASPDGSRIAFVSSRGDGEDLYLISADGSGEVRLTRTAEEEGPPGWTADGKHIWFPVLSNDASRLYSIDPDGKNVTLLGTVPGRAAKLSPDGTRVLYASGSWTAVRLFVSDLNGANAQQLTDGTSVVWGPRWSPDGKSIVFTSRDGTGQLYIAVIKADGSGRRQVTHLTAAEGRPQMPSWSPDGGRLAVQVNELDKATAHICTVDVATGTTQKLALHSQPYLDEIPSWFPDGRRIVFQSNRTGTMEVWMMNADGSGQRQVTGIQQRSAASPPAIFSGGPRVSPDGSRIVFTSNRTGRSQIYLMNADGAGVRQLTTDSAGADSPNWSPDGKRIVHRVGATKQIAIMNADGTARRTVAEITGNQSPSWSPDGSKILYAAGKFPNINIYTMNAQGADQRNVSPNPGFDYDPAWSPGGSTIAFVNATRESGPKVWLMNAAGSGRRRLTQSEEAEERPTWSPDGRHLAFQSAKRGGSRDAYVHIVDTKTGADQRLGTHPQPCLDETPSWFPDGKRLAFQSDCSGRMEVWVMNADGMEPHPLTVTSD